WNVEDFNSTGVWYLEAPRRYCQFTNITITDCSVLYSDFNFSGQIEFRLDVALGYGDDDLIGFVLGFNPGDSTNPNSDYLLVDWKSVTQLYSNWGTATAGLALSRVTGVFTPGTGGGPIDLWSHTGVCAELARGNVYGQRGWAAGKKYFFRVSFSPTVVDIAINGVPEFHVTGNFKPGRFGCYNFSQSGMEFQFPILGSFQTTGTGCKG